jgi:hypothetical protein
MTKRSSKSFPLFIIGSCVLNHEVHADTFASHTVSLKIENSCPPKTFEDNNRIQLINGTNIDIIVLFEGIN